MFASVKPVPCGIICTYYDLWNEFMFKCKLAWIVNIIKISFKRNSRIVPNKFLTFLGIYSFCITLKLHKTFFTCSFTSYIKIIYVERSRIAHSLVIRVLTSPPMVLFYDFECAWVCVCARARSLTCVYLSAGDEEKFKSKILKCFKPEIWYANLFFL